WHEMSNGLSNAATFSPKRQMTEEKIIMKAIVVTDQAAGTAGMKLVERLEPQAAINDVVVQIHASGFVPTEMAWPSTWTDRRDRRGRFDGDATRARGRRLRRRHRTRGRPSEGARLRRAGVRRPRQRPAGRRRRHRSGV